MAVNNSTFCKTHGKITQMTFCIILNFMTWWKTTEIKYATCQIRPFTVEFVVSQLMVRYESVIDFRIPWRISVGYLAFVYAKYYRHKPWSLWSCYYCLNYKKYWSRLAAHFEFYIYLFIKLGYEIGCIFHNVSFSSVGFLR